MMKFMPTGGVNTGNIKEYLAFEKIVCCGGSWMVKSSMIAEKKFATITKLASEAVELANSA
jgi:2-dehydro-3-deoxyphosphogluconate aldolase/(4S)-4-hydroxy-2-oxoglutarate aldolase